MLIVGLSIPLGFLMLYNTNEFRRPFELSGTMSIPARWPQAMSLQTQFSTPWPSGCRPWLFYDGNNQWYLSTLPSCTARHHGVVALVSPFASSLSASA